MIKLLDLFCGAGGAAMGYHQAGFKDITGVDIKPQKRYPFKFIQSDALEYLAEHGTEYDVIHASPPCQAYSVTANLPWSHGGPELIEPLRELLRRTGKYYVIENVPLAPLEYPVMLCGLMFDLKVIRHRNFETYPRMLAPTHSQHPKWVKAKTLNLYSAFSRGLTIITPAGNGFSKKDAAIAMQIDWMTRDELAQAIPPAYTKYIGIQILYALHQSAQSDPKIRCQATTSIPSDAGSNMLTAIQGATQ
ncbi:MAG: hypothetical protein A2W35_08090 [Chloroflexi bacterium RBG_16_57_11]|nr:MAG: hypothetical protein A2W35_08090 [Chloroflexi bacterium RBG_16_57_11]